MASSFIVSPLVAAMIQALAPGKLGPEGPKPTFRREVTLQAEDERPDWWSPAIERQIRSDELIDKTRPVKIQLGEILLDIPYNHFGWYPPVYYLLQVNRASFIQELAFWYPDDTPPDIQRMNEPDFRPIKNGQPPKPEEFIVEIYRLGFDVRDGKELSPSKKNQNVTSGRGAAKLDRYSFLGWKSGPAVNGPVDSFKGYIEDRNGQYLAMCDTWNVTYMQSLCSIDFYLNKSGFSGTLRFPTAYMAQWRELFIFVQQKLDSWKQP